jgi:hypothetical protein
MPSAGRNEPFNKDNPAFRQLQELLARPRKDLHWHYEIGACVAELRTAVSDTREGRHGTEWSERLAKAVNLTPWPLRKALYFRERLPKAEVEKLSGWEVTWTMVVHSFTVPKHADRMRLLRRAKNEGWDSVRLRFEIQQREGIRHTGTGRPKRPARDFGPAVGLRQLNYQTRRWLQHYDAAWRQNGEALLKNFGAKDPSVYPAWLVELLPTAEENLARLADVVRQFRGPLRELAQKAAKEDRRRRGGAT